MVWRIEKNFVAANNKQHNLTNVEQLFRKKREETDGSTCKKCVEHVKNIENHCYETNRIIDVAIEKMEFTVDPGTDSESSEMSNVEDDDEE